MKSRSTYLDASAKIFIIDDSYYNLDILSTILTESGYNVVAEMNSEIAFDQIIKCYPDLIILDVVMPKIDGFKLCEVLHLEPKTKDIPIIFMTALTDIEQKVKGLNLGAVDYITKPFQKEEILARIQVHLRIRQLNLELEEQKQQLEQRVQARTAELSQALENLKQTQLQLVQAEKISLIGQLVAGVAHEVNNPIGFIATNLYHAKNYVEDLVHLVQLYQHHFPQPGASIEKQIEEMDLQHVLEDLPKLVSSMKLGTDSVRGIMQSLRTFSRADGDTKKAVNIHEGLETTLMILQHRLKAKPNRSAIKVIKKYANLPLIKCYSGQLNQVFMNLLANAIDALEDSLMNRDQEAKNLQIHVCTSLDQERVIIQIADNGMGIPESKQNEIFQPFFTTKAEGKGTGLGLSICQQIIREQHGGTLECVSSPGEGTEFLITIPL
ncbi:ATP-binding protein [Calothrix rhizosoleniae]|uniref:ATP-binding protein n=1 Tax=Calothrix rhizosoleniae TaxID=888997 RepID=UPI000B49A8F0|nr:ATP-binding protein [Calothrix rhizosoleniae]